MIMIYRTKYIFICVCTDKNIEEIANMHEVELSEKERAIALTMTPALFLALITGSSEEPLCGFRPRPSVSFDMSNEQPMLPVIASCSNSITFHKNPLISQNPGQFVKLMLTVIVNGKFFLRP